MNIDLNNITVTFDYQNDEVYDIRRCLETLYQTPEGSCPLDREFGINLDFVGMPMDIAQNLFAVEITDKTDRYEPRAMTKEIKFETTADGQLKAEVVITNG